MKYYPYKHKHCVYCNVIKLCCHTVKFRVCRTKLRSWVSLRCYPMYPIVKH